MLGINGLWGFIYHFFFGELAELIGWPNSPFQYEVAYANLTIAILGFSSWWLKRRDYLLAAMVAYISWFFADGLGHAMHCCAKTTPLQTMPERFYSPIC